MKYINHMTSSSDDEKHEALIEKCGMAGYGAYWVVAEKIAAQIRPECVSTSLTLSWRNWSRHLRVDDVRTTKYLINAIADAGLILLKIAQISPTSALPGGRSGARHRSISHRSETEIVTIDMPNILKYGDEYTKRVGIKSRQTPDKLPTISGSPALPALLKDQSLLSKTTSPKNGSGRVQAGYTDEFKEFWAAYPRKIGKLLAFKKYLSVLRHPEHTKERVNDSAEEYASVCAKEKREDRFILHPATFLEKDRWKDYCFDRDGPTEAEEKPGAEA